MRVFQSRPRHPSRSPTPPGPGLLLLINRKILPAPLRIRGVRVAVLVWSIALFGTLSVLTILKQYKDLVGG
jgi:hypothetical protein